MKQTILIVEDEADIALTMRLSLEMTGCEVLLASNEDEALGAIEKRTPDLVLLDVTLAESSGWDLLARLRGDERFGSLPIVMTSALPEDEVAEHARRLGATDHLVKPFDVHELQRTVARALGTSGST